MGGPQAADGASSDDEQKTLNPATRDMVALDCEMCYCGEALEVTRISLVDSAGEVGDIKPHDNIRYSRVCIWDANPGPLAEPVCSSNHMQLLWRQPCCHQVIPDIRKPHVLATC